MLAATNCLVVFSLSALRFIVAVSFFFGFNACICLFGALSVICPTRFGVRQPFERLSPACASVELKVQFQPEKHSECCQTETENALTAHDRCGAEKGALGFGPALS